MLCEADVFVIQVSNTALMRVYQAFFVVVLVVVANYKGLTKDDILALIEEGPIKAKIQNPSRGWFFESEEEKASAYILDVLRRAGTEERCRPITTMRGYWGDWIETSVMLGNHQRMQGAVDCLLSDGTPENKKAGFAAISSAYDKISEITPCPPRRHQ